MPPVEAPTPTPEVQHETDSISKPMVGIIYPPPEVRSILFLHHHFHIQFNNSHDDFYDLVIYTIVNVSMLYYYSHSKKMRFSFLAYFFLFDER